VILLIYHLVGSILAISRGSPTVPPVPVAAPTIPPMLSPTVHPLRWRHVSPEEKGYTAATVADLSNATLLRCNVKEGEGDLAYFELQDRLETHLTATKSRKPRALVVGANNGILADRLTPILIAHEWGAFMVEAIPVIYAELVANMNKKYGNGTWDGLYLINHAVTDTPNTQVVMDVSLNRRQAAHMKGTGKLVSNATVGVSGTKLKFVGKKITMPGDTLQNLLNTAPYEWYDVLQIDVEGFDESVLKQVDAMNWEPNLISIETCETFCKDYLSRRGYESFQSPGALIAYKNLPSEMGEKIKC
jgi:FkbM family methyltransferase